MLFELCFRHKALPSWLSRFALAVPPVVLYNFFIGRALSSPKGERERRGGKFTREYLTRSRFGSLRFLQQGPQVARRSCPEIFDGVATPSRDRILAVRRLIKRELNPCRRAGSSNACAMNPFFFSETRSDRCRRWCCYSLARYASVNTMIPHLHPVRALFRLRPRKLAAKRHLRILSSHRASRVFALSLARAESNRIGSHRDTMMNAAMSAPRRETARIARGIQRTRESAESSGLRDFAARSLSLSVSLALSRERRIYSRSISRDFLPVNLRPLADCPRNTPAAAEICMRLVP